jgi:hypothetical protein
VAPRLQLIDSRRDRELGVFDVRCGGSDSVDSITPVGEAASRQYCLAPIAFTRAVRVRVTPFAQEQ